MKIHPTKEWCQTSAKIEGDSCVQAGLPNAVVPPEKGQTPSVAAVPTGSTHSVIEIQNALRLLTRVMKRDDELIFTGGDIIVFRDHLYRTQEISTMLGSNGRDEPRP